MSTDTDAIRSEARSLHGVGITRVDLIAMCDDLDAALAENASLRALVRQLAHPSGIPVLTLAQEALLAAVLADSPRVDGGGGA